MKKGKLKIGDRVEHDFLGKGTVVKTPKVCLYNDQCMVLVQWDKDPDVRYNLGNNPSLESTDSMKKFEV